MHKGEEIFYAVEVKIGDGQWGATPKTFLTEEEAHKEAARLIMANPFISESRVVTRKIEEHNEARVGN